MKVVVCGDTADSRAITGLAQGTDVLIHEAPTIAANFVKEIGGSAWFSIISAPLGTGVTSRWRTCRL